MTAGHVYNIFATVPAKLVVWATSLLLCLAPAWSHEPNWMDRGWIHLRQTGPNNSANRVLVDPARITSEKIYWDAISQVCHSGIGCTVLFHLHVTLVTYESDHDTEVVPDVSSFVTSIIESSVAFFYYDAESGENNLVFSCRTIENEGCY